MVGSSWPLVTPDIRITTPQVKISFQRAFLEGPPDMAKDESSMQRAMAGKTKISRRQMGPKTQTKAYKGKKYYSVKCLHQLWTHSYKLNLNSHALSTVAKKLTWGNAFMQAALKLSGRAKNNYIHLFITSVSNTSNHKKKQLAGVVIKKEFDIFERTPPKSSTINFTFLSLLLWFWDDWIVAMFE